jgi:light-regulated signal transduction histidine kinase (bacteriophytochrome)
MGSSFDPANYSDHPTTDTPENLAVSDDGKVRFRKELSIPESMRLLTDAKDVSTVVSSGLNLPQLSPDVTERVFPIRSVVTVDSNPSSALQTPSLEITSPFGEDCAFSPANAKTWGQHTTSPTEATNREATPSSNQKENRTRKNEPKFEETAGRMSKDGDQSPAVASENSPNARLQDTQGKVANSEEIQPFGALLVLQETDGRLSVQIASRNAKDIIGYSPEKLFDLESFCGILRHDQREDFLSHARFIREEKYNIELHGPDILILFIYAPDGSTRSFWCTMHASKENMDYIICELEPEEDSMSVFSFIDHGNPGTNLKPDNEPGTATTETSSNTGPLRALRMFNERKREFDLTNILNATSRVLQLAWNAQSLDTLFNNLIGVIKELIGFYRVTVYQFDSDWSGVAVADAVDPEMPPDSSKNVRVPEYISSEELRRLHLLNKVCLLYSQNRSRAGLVYRVPEPRARVDMTHCYLLSTSPACSEVFAAMPSHTCMSIGIYVFGKLWGLISCQTFDQDMRLLPPIHKLCWLISNTLSSNIERLSYTLPFNIQEQSSTAEVKVYKCDTAQAGDLVSLFGADCGASSIFGETTILGKPSDLQEVLAVVEYLRMRSLDRILWSTAIAKDFPDLNYPPGFRSISGLVYIPLSADSQDFIIFFRAPRSSEYTNSGDTHDCPRANCNPDGNAKCFRPLAWSAVDLGKAYILSVIYRTFIEVWQQKEAALQGTQLMRLLLANSAHEFRTPLNAIINYLEIALDGSLSQETRENLSRSHSASKSLIYIINDLLDLTNAENGQNLIKDEVLDLSETLRGATDIFWEEAKQKHVGLHIVQHSRLPRVLGDQRRVRQVITNLISNAVQHTSTGAVTVESCILPDSSEPEKIGIEVAIHDTGAGMSQETVEALFCELEQVSNKDYIRNTCKDKVADYGESTNVLGLGLALVARIVRNMNGQLSVKSEKDKGSCFKIRLKFPLPASELGPQPDSMTEKSSDGNIGLDTSQGDVKHDREQTQHCGPDHTKSDEVGNTCGKDQFSREETGHDNAGRCDISISVKTEDSQLRHFSEPDTTQSLDTTTLQKEEGRIDDKTPNPTTGQDPEKPNAQTHQAAAHNPPNNSPSKESPDSTRTNLHVLVAEDDPINSMIVCKRLEKSGHTVHLTGNGKECAAVYREKPSSFDAILMDIQVWILTPPLPG